MTRRWRPSLSQPMCSPDSLSIPRSGPAGKATDQELIALAVAQAVTGMASDRQFLGMIGRLLPGCFPELPGQSQFNRRLRRLTPQITTVQIDARRAGRRPAACAWSTAP